MTTKGGTYSDDAYPFAKITNEGRPYLSPSQITRVHRCGEAWRAYYHEGKRTPTSWNMHVGDTVHKAVETALEEFPLPEQRMELSQQNLEECMEEFVSEAALDIANSEDIQQLDPDDGPEKAPHPSEDDAEEVAGYLENIAEDAALACLEWFPDEWTVQHVEHTLIGQITDHVDFLGYADLIAEDEEGRTVIVDWKTTGQKKYSLREKDALQAALYSEYGGYESAYTEAIIPYVVPYKTKPAIVLPFQAPIDAESLHWSRTLAVNAVRKIENQDFTPNPIGAGWMCSPKYCGHFNECDGAARFIEERSLAMDEFNREDE